MDSFTAAFLVEYFKRNPRDVLLDMVQHSEHVTLESPPHHMRVSRSDSKIVVPTGFGYADVMTIAQFEAQSEHITLESPPHGGQYSYQTNERGIVVALYHGWAQS